MNRCFEYLLFEMPTAPAFKVRWLCVVDVLSRFAGVTFLFLLPAIGLDHSFESNECECKNAMPLANPAETRFARP